MKLKHILAHNVKVVDVHIVVDMEQSQNKILHINNKNNETSSIRVD
jgi:hypothetical protein